MTTIACLKTPKNVLIAADRQNTFAGEGFTGSKFNSFYKKIFHPAGNKKIVIGCAGRVQGAAAFRNDKKLMKAFSDLADVCYQKYQENVPNDEIGEFIFDQLQQVIINKYQAVVEKWPELQEEVKRRAMVEEDESGEAVLTQVKQVASSIKVIVAIGTHILTISEMFDIALFDEPICSIGSGNEYAMGAIYALDSLGKVPVKKMGELGIEAASRYDPFTGKEVIFLETETVK